MQLSILITINYQLMYLFSGNYHIESHCDMTFGNGLIANSVLAVF